MRSNKIIRMFYFCTICSVSHVGFYARPNTSVKFIKALGWDCPQPKCKHITIIKYSVQIKNS